MQKNFGKKFSTLSLSVGLRRHSAFSNTCDVAIIGSGIMGLNVAYQLARRDPNINIKIFEKAPNVGFGSTGASSGICRTFYTFPEMVEFARDGINLYKNWNEYLNCDLNDSNIIAKFTKTGLLAMVPRQ